MGYIKRMEKKNQSKLADNLGMMMHAHNPSYHLTGKKIASSVPCLGYRVRLWFKF